MLHRQHARNHLQIVQEPMIRLPAERRLSFDQRVSRANQRRLAGQRRTQFCNRANAITPLAVVPHTIARRLERAPRKINAFAARICIAHLMTILDALGVRTPTARHVRAAEGSAMSYSAHIGEKARAGADPKWGSPIAPASVQNARERGQT
mgnify:CR=1 FL=1